MASTKLTIGAETITHPNLMAIYVIGQLGLVLYMFLVGTEFRADHFKSRFRSAASVSAAGIVVPFLLAFALIGVVLTGLAIGWAYLFVDAWRLGQPLTLKLNGPVEAWFEDLGENPPVAKA